MARRRQRGNADTATRILDIAERLVQSRGFNGFSYADVLREKRMCLCGMLAADYDTLPKPMRDAVIRFFDDNELWLTRVLGQGHEDGSVRIGGSASEAAQAIIGGLEGALLVARPYGDVARFKATATQLLEGLANTSPAERAAASSASA